MAEKNPDEVFYKLEVGLLDKAFWDSHPVFSLTIDGYLLGNPPLGGISKISILLKMATHYPVPRVVKLSSERSPPCISGLTVKEAANGWRQNIHPMASNPDICKWGLFSGVSLPFQSPLESCYAGVLELSNHLLIVRSPTPSHLLEHVAGNKVRTAGTMCRLPVRTRRSIAKV